MSYIINKITKLLLIAKEMGPKNTTLFLVAYPIKNILHNLLTQYIYTSSFFYIILRIMLAAQFYITSDPNPMAYGIALSRTGHFYVDFIVDSISVILLYFIGWFTGFCFNV
jgi:hypothetical protein